MAIRGITIVDNTQIVLIDTPGLFNPKKRLDRAMVNAAWAGVGDADVVVLLADCTRGVDEETSLILDRLKDKNIPLILALFSFY